ncbi:hypothetical protein BFP77_05235 [Maribacter sp. 4U21]|uniref:DUF2752 domain-containing protein n=1 Tax=Maribacter sp. 4U21 TaxID=1889779 RepID=UPI000C14CCDC|nr:DUF2752 domain-containing protein [Maribacter sp. 4U21]PIB30024.1 hypothetical protein BFP77_05235 [Maribacter sp. 4U21]
MRYLAFIFFLGIENYMLPCFTKKLFGFDCPGCGIQRSLLHLARGEFGAAFEMYPAIYPMLLLFIFLAADKFFNFKNSNTISLVLMVTTVGTLLINYILKFI